MIRHLVLAVVAVSWAAGIGQGQEWARKMFDKSAHDFGTIARGAKAVYRFQVKNLYEETVHISGVRSSCGCTDPKIVNPRLKTFETGEIVAQFNTVSFEGSHTATLTVTIDEPYPAEVQLKVYGDVRKDVVFDPGSVQFGSIDQGAPSMKKVAVRYAGRSDWKILDVLSANSHFEVEMEETSRNGGRVAYEMLVRLKEDTPPGYLNEPLVLVTNDRNASRIPIQVEGRVVPEISVTPNSLVLGEVPLGKSVTKKLVVRGKRPFRIVEVDCDDDCFSFQLDQEPKALHLVAVEFQPREKTGNVKQTIRILTDRGNSETLLVAYATVVTEEASNSR